MKNKADIAIIGLAVMGENLIMNMESKGFTVSCYNYTSKEIDTFMTSQGKGKNIIPCYTIEELVESLERPRKIMLMVRAGQPVDDLIQQMMPFLEKGDIIIDGGNSHYLDTERRMKEVEKKGILYIGTGISGGEEGALNGPSIMPGGSPDAWNKVKPIFMAICAHTEEGEPCCDWVGQGGAGHFLKMVHNGIEYGDMQLICEIYQLMKDGLGLNNKEMQDIFADWNNGVLKSYLIEITSNILGYKDREGNFTLDQILDVAGQKGTGKWAVEAALNNGQVLNTISEAVFSRNLSALKKDRELASLLLIGPHEKFKGNKTAMIIELAQALYASKIVTYAQGFLLLRAEAAEQGWNLNYSSIATMWQGGCIIRSAFLKQIKKAFEENPKLDNIMLDSFFIQALTEAQASCRNVATTAIQLGIPIPAISSALAFYDGYRTSRLPANLLQALRDYFGTHTYERTDSPRGVFFHTNWTGRGGDVSSTYYNA